MISVCIPVYNYDACPLVQNLAAQAAALDAEVELVCIDDGSSAEWRQRNQPLQSMSHYVQLEENIGRARIRNLFLEHTTGEWLVFLDNDMVISDGFLQRYVDTLKDKPAVVVGGVAYDHRYDDAEHRLRMLYGHGVESRTAAERSSNPYRSFMTGNFMIHRDVLEQLRFDERLHGYGHEDTLFGYHLEQHGVEVRHIDNPAVNGNVETNVQFLRKTEEGVENLATIFRFMSGEPGFTATVKLLRTYECLRKWHLTGAVGTISRWLRRPLARHLAGGRCISVRQLNFYKLGLFIEIINNK